MQKTYFYRGLFYLMGLLILALGITLNTKTGLGVSPIISVSFSISTIWHFNFGNTTLVLYALFVVVERSYLRSEVSMPDNRKVFLWNTLIR